MYDYLPDQLRSEIQSLSTRRKKKLATLAREAGINVTTMYRFMKGDTRRLNDNTILKIAATHGCEVENQNGKIKLVDAQIPDATLISLTVGELRQIVREASKQGAQEVLSKQKKRDGGNS